MFYFEFFLLEFENFQIAHFRLASDSNLIQGAAAAYRDRDAARTIEKSYMTDLLQGLIDSGCNLKAVPIKNGWLELDSFSDLISFAIVPVFLLIYYLLYQLV